MVMTAWLPQSSILPTPSVGGETSQLQMKPSPLQPACRAEERIFQWKGVNPAPMSTINHPFMKTIYSLASHATLCDTSGYGAGLRKYHIFCDIFSITESDRLPASFKILHSFALWAATDPEFIPVEALEGVRLEPISVTAVRKYLSAVRAWHFMQGWPAPLSDEDLKCINFSLRGLENIQVGRRLMPPRPPITLQMLKALRLTLEIGRPFDACIWAMALSAFWGMMRFGEVSVKSIRAFDSKLHLKRSDIHFDTDLDSSPYAHLDLPSAKTVKAGKVQSVFLTEQKNLCPLAALRNLFQVVPARANDPLFSWADDKGNVRPMVKQTAIRCINGILTGWLGYLFWAFIQDWRCLIFPSTKS
ncbi:hypothetical protein M422DRAFT_258712 [Sphaerobolus stellatus SS14]|uniref:Uncharacterized protein n=1 Tax=Sphaerobolus stellatus (strain SS14) TaxID=990650 RepID=A0A0C9VLU0_SPHS4|nr:hypothetical protein M422DRAFT_258712 [Sphaerobolus stellatus SS14]